MPRPIYLVAVYEIDRSYGGSEEGGWWYDTGDLVRIVRVKKNEEDAYQVAQRINRALAFKRRVRTGFIPISSVAYRGGHLSATVYRDNAPSHFPETRPYYE